MPITLGLNLIVGPGEAFELDRCLTSCQGSVFDEVVVTVTSGDAEVRAVAERHATRVPHFPWVGNFAKARNFGFSHATTDFVMWLDADDVLSPRALTCLGELKARLEGWDMVVCDYVCAHDGQGRPSMIMPRERVVRRCEAIAWVDPIHEFLEVRFPDPRVLRTDIQVDHFPTHAGHADRNLGILLDAVRQDGCSPRMRFYLGKELLDAGRWDEAAEVLEGYLATGDPHLDQACIACILLSKFHFDRQDPEASERFARRGIALCPEYAENHFRLGQLAENAGAMAAAMVHYQTALSQPLGGHMAQLAQFYGYVPAARLSILFHSQGDFPKALYYCELALKHRPGDPSLLNNRKMMRAALGGGSPLGAV